MDSNTQHSRTRPITRYIFCSFLTISIAVNVVLVVTLYIPYLKEQPVFPAISGRGHDVHQTLTELTSTENYGHRHGTKDPANILLKNNASRNLSSFSSQLYHRFYPVNCTGIFAGDTAAIKSSELLLSKLRDAKNRIPVPSDYNGNVQTRTMIQTAKLLLVPGVYDVISSTADISVRQWVQDCSTFKDERGYPRQPLSKEEADYPIAYSMVVYQNSAQVERLLRAIYQPQNVYCIHIDKASAAHFNQAIRKLAGCFPNVFIASKLEDVKWGSFECVLADLHCMEDLLYHPIQWKYVLNLCGMDFPLKTNLEIVRQLKAYNDRNCIEGNIRPSSNSAEKDRFKRIKGPAPHNITVYKGDTYIAATREFVDFFVNHQVARDYLKWLRDVRVADAYFTSSLNRLPYAPGGYVHPSLECNVRFRKWVLVKYRAGGNKFEQRPECIGKAVHGLCIFATGYLKYLYRTPQLFVNKFHYDFDPVAMQCTEELLNYRTTHPEEFDQWENFPVTNFSWQKSN